eukprot:SM000009S23593  [mRNA]  locus=s9:972011:982036:- [translate_table: standard]
MTVQVLTLLTPDGSEIWRQGSGYEIGALRSRGGPPDAAAAAAAAAAAGPSGGGGGGGGGGRRVDTFSLKLEERVYDEVPEAEYAALVARRRQAAGGFVVGDDGLGYADIGEEDEWDRARGDAEEDSGEEDGGADGGDGHARRDGHAARRTNTKRGGDAAAKKAAVAAGAAAPGRRNVASMFAAAARPSGGGGGWAGDADSLLDDILAGIGADDLDREREKRRRRGLPVPWQAEARLPAAAEGGAPLTAMLRSGAKEETVAAIPMTVPARSSVEDLVDAGPVESMAPVPAASSLRRPHEDAGGGTRLAAVAGGEASNTEEASALVSGTGCAAADEVLPAAEEDHRRPSLNAWTSLAGQAETASAGWQAAMKASAAAAVVGHESKGSPQVAVAGSDDDDAAAASGNGALPLDADGSLPFFLLDAHEEAAFAGSGGSGTPGNVYLFGKVAMTVGSPSSGGGCVSCCVVVKGLQRCVFAVPTPGGPLAPGADPEAAALEAAVSHGEPGASLALTKRLQVLAAPLKQELRDQLARLGVASFTMVPVKRSYAFERAGIPAGEQYCLKLVYPFSDPALPMDLHGEHFAGLFGTNTSALELLLLKRKIKGPSWLAIRDCVQVLHGQVSHCRMEVAVGSPKDVGAAPPAAARPSPRLVVASLDLKTVIDPQRNVSEIASASVVYCRAVKIDGPTPMTEWNTAHMLGHFSAVRRLDGGVFPMGFDAELARMNASSGGEPAAFSKKGSERELLSFLLARLVKLDADVLVGHNVAASGLDVLLHRLQACKVGNWSAIGKLKRRQMPRLGGGGGLAGGGGAGPGTLACVAGRLLCDTYLSARELLREVSYSLTALAERQLGKVRRELSPADTAAMFSNAGSLCKLLELGETDAWLTLGLMFHLSILPLTRQLTALSGNLWSRTLQGARAQRIEMLLCHEFHERKYILPDKVSVRERDRVMAGHGGGKRRTAEDADGDDLLDAELLDEPDVGNAADPAAGSRRKRQPAYAGGLVLEPKKGLYDRFVVLLDFNSLYPSIIQEYNICFTTVLRRRDAGSSAAASTVPALPMDATPGVLPQVIRTLVQRRRQVKEMMKKEGDAAERQRLDIRQQALKLTANSMYGCLGFNNSRFYAKPLAELITSQGREILQSTVDLVQNNLNLEVIYGDTDSIMIHTGLDELSKVWAVGARVKKEVNKRYKLLEIEVDGVFKRMLLLKKKKYACIKMEPNGDGTFKEVMEQKGLDIVRRDWSILSKDVGNYCLQQILSGSSREDVVSAIHEHLSDLAKRMRAGEVELDKYEITKTLTKAPEDYPDARSQPHVQVALRRKQSGRRDGCAANDTVPYIICKDRGSGTAVQGSIAERARHPDELRSNNSNWDVDIDYYLSQQIHPVVSRLCAPIEGTDPARLADCLGLDATKFHRQSIASTHSAKEDALLTSAASLDDDERYRHCEPLELVCPRCSLKFPFTTSPPPSSSSSSCPAHLDSSNGSPVTPLPGRVDASSSCSPLRCPRCPADHASGPPTMLSPAMLANQVKRRAEDFVARYYDARMICDEELCGSTSRSPSLRVLGGQGPSKGAACPNYPRCTGRMVRNYSEADLYKQLSHFLRLLDPLQTLNKIEDSAARQMAERKLAPLHSTMEAAASVVRAIQDRSAYKWIQMDRLCVVSA